MELITKSYHGFTIEFELIDGQLMANATAMCAVFGKRPAKWLELESVKRYVGALEAKSEIRTLVETRQGGANPGTWIHERLILKLAQWLNVDFEIQCDEWMGELLRTGRVALATLTPAEILLQQATQMVEQERRVKELEGRQQVDRLQLQAVEAAIAEVAAKQATIDTSSYSVAGYAGLHKIRLTLQTASGFGRRAATISRAQGYPVGKVHDARYGEVNVYHRDVLRQVMDAPTVAVVLVS